jgi:hypothetical protein
MVKRGVFRGVGGGGGGGGYLNNTLLGGFCRTVLAGRWGGTVENNGDRKHFCTKKPSKTAIFPVLDAKKRVFSTSPECIFLTPFQHPLKLATRTLQHIYTLIYYSFTTALIPLYDITHFFLKVGFTHVSPLYECVPALVLCHLWSARDYRCCGPEFELAIPNAFGRLLISLD